VSGSAYNSVPVGTKAVMKKLKTEPAHRVSTSLRCETTQTRLLHCMVCPKLH